MASPGALVSLTAASRQGLAPEAAMTCAARRDQAHVQRLARLQARRVGGTGRASTMNTSLARCSLE
jgi:hypothetical protein